MTMRRISAVAIALSIAFGFVDGAGSTQRSAKGRNLSGTIVSSKRMADGKEWTTANLNVSTSSSYCYDDAEANCRRYGRLYTWESAQRGCQSLGNGWRLPTDDEWRQMATRYGGLGNDSPAKGKAAYGTPERRDVRLQCRARGQSLGREVRPAGGTRDLLDGIRKRFDHRTVL